MFCLFRNSHIHPRLNRYVILLSLFGVIGWLYFAIIEKSLVSMLMSGEALIVDLVFGLPLVLMMGVVVYATIYWACKILIIIALPKFIIPPAPEIDELQEQLEEDNIQDLEERHGSEYWTQEGTHSEVDSSKAKQKASDEVK
ncbi:MAG: hypothetical protein ACQEQR_01710 [Pseudomonadota bacterium]